MTKLETLKHRGSKIILYRHPEGGVAVWTEFSGFWLHGAGAGRFINPAAAAAAGCAMIDQLIDEPPFNNME